MFPYTAFSLVSPSIHAHASIYGDSVIFPPFQFQYISGCRQSLNDGSMHEIVLVIGGRRALGYGALVPVLQVQTCSKASQVPAFDRACSKREKRVSFCTSPWAKTP